MAKTERWFCPVCGERLYLRSRDNEDDPFLLSPLCVLHNACLDDLKRYMADHDLPDCARGAREALRMMQEKTA